MFNASVVLCSATERDFHLQTSTSKSFIVHCNVTFFEHSVSHFRQYSVSNEFSFSFFSNFVNSHQLHLLPRSWKVYFICWVIKLYLFCGWGIILWWWLIILTLLFLETFQILMKVCGRSFLTQVGGRFVCLGECWFFNIFDISQSQLKKSFTEKVGSNQSPF